MAMPLLSPTSPSDRLSPGTRTLPLLSTQHPDPDLREYNRRALEALPWPVAAVLFSELDPASAWTLGWASRDYFPQLRIAWSLRNLLLRFVTDVPRFRSRLRDAGGVIAGGLPTQFFARETWPDSDMDIFFVDYHSPEWPPEGHYDPSDALSLLISFLMEKEGYVLAPGGGAISGDRILLDGSTDHCPGYDFVLLNLRRSTQVVQIVIHRWSGDPVFDGNPLLSSLLEKFYGTHVMNFITSDTAVSVFPRITFVRREMVVVRRGDEGLLELRNSTPASVEKYKRRGWASGSFRGEELTGVRSVGDDKCWVIGFDGEGFPLRPARRVPDSIRFEVGPDGLVRLRSEDSESLSS